MLLLLWLRRSVDRVNISASIYVLRSLLMVCWDIVPVISHLFVFFFFFVDSTVNIMK
jgi:hypothetical protein